MQARARRIINLVLAIIISISTKVMAVTSKHKPKPRHRQPQHYTGVFAPTGNSLIEQNREIERLGLQRMKDKHNLQEAIDSGDLVPLPETRGIVISSTLPINRRYCRPWTGEFLEDLGAVYHTRFKQSLYVDSAVRTEEVQSWLRRIMGMRAAPVTGEKASSHLAGLTVDISLNHLTVEQRQFVEYVLEYLTINDLVIVEEEQRNRCFHIMVMSEYYKGAI